MFDSKCNGDGKEKKVIERNKSIPDIILQCLMGFCLVYVAYKVIYRPMVYGVDIVMYTLINVGVASLIYMVLNKLYYILHDEYKTMSIVRINIEFAISFSITLMLAIKLGQSLYYSKGYFIFVCVLMIIDSWISLLGLKSRYN